MFHPRVKGGGSPAQRTVDAQKRLRHLNFFRHECFLEVRVPRVRLPDGKIRLVEPPWVGRLDGFTLLFEALVLALCREMPFATVARLVGLSWHRVHPICARYVELALADADLSDVFGVAIEETSSRRGHNYVTLVADMSARRVIFVTENRDSECIAQFADHLRAHHALPYQIACKRSIKHTSSAATAWMARPVQSLVNAA